MALLAATALLALAAPAQAQTEVWSATLTPADIGSGVLGCSNGVSTGRCSSTSLLSEDSFTYDSTDYNITVLFLRPDGRFQFQVDAAITTATAALTLVVGSTALVLADAPIIPEARIWNSSGVSLTIGTDITVKLTAPGTPNAAPTVANTIPNQTATAGTAFSYAFLANTFADTDTGDMLTYTATQSDDSALPSWLSFAAATRTFSGMPTAADVGTVSVKVTASDGNGGSVSDTFDIVVSAAANTLATGAPTITGTAQVGQTLTAVTTGITDADGLTSVSYTYQWIRVATDNTETNISSAAASTYMLVAADQGTTVKVTVSFTDDANNPETLTSAATATVSAAANTLATGAPTITGTAQVDQTLTAVTTGIMDANGLTTPNYTYQWIRVNGTDANIAGENSSTYILVDADLGKTIKVQVTFTDDASNTETLTSDATATVVAAGTAPTMVLSPTSLDVPEAGYASYSVKLGTLPTADVTVSIGGTSGTDLTVNRTSLTFTTSNWDMVQTVRVSAARDDDATHDMATLTHTATGGGYGSVSADLPVTVTDITRMRLVAVVETVTEGTSKPIRARLPMPLDDDVTITVTVAPNGGRADEYELSDNTTLTIAAGDTESTGNVVFTSLDDFTDTGVRYFNATLTPDHPRVDAGTERLTVVDDDNTISVLQVAPSRIFESGGTATLLGAKVSLHEGVVKMEVSLEPSGRATLSGNTLTFPPGALYATETLTITAVDNMSDETDQVITISATVTEGRGIRTPAPVQLTIVDDDGMSPEVALVLTPPRVREGLASTVTALASAPLDNEATITVSASPGHSDTRTDDYALSADPVLTIPAGGTRSTGTVTIATVDDQFHVGSRRRVVTVSGTVTGGGGVSNPADQTLTVLEDDQLIRVAVIATPATIAEGEVSTITLRSLGGALPAAVNVTIRESSDEVELSADPVLMIADGETESTGTVTLTAVQDTDMRNGVITVFGDPDNAFVRVAPASVFTVDDDATEATLTVSPVPARFYEGETSTIIAALSRTLSDDVTVTIGVDEADVNHTATADDYTLSGDLTFTILAGDMRGTGPALTASNDEYYGPLSIRQVVLDIASVTGTDRLNVIKHSDWYIFEDEEQPRVTLAVTPASIAENNGQSTVTASLNTIVESDVEVTVTTEPAVAAQSDDFTQTGTLLTISAGQKTGTGTVTISAVDNDVDGPDKNLVVRGAVEVVGMEQSGLVWFPYDESLTIRDDDTRGVKVSPATLRVNKGSTGTYTVVLNSQPTASVTVTAAQDSDAVDGAATISHAVMGGDYGAVMAASVAVTLAGVPNTAATGAPTITGTAQVGQTLTAVTTGIMDADGLTSPTYTYQWIRVDGTEADIAGENSSTYTLGDADLGKTLKVRVTFADDLGHTETLTSAATATVGAGAVATAPTVNDVAVTSTPASGTTYYLAGEVIEFTVTFSAPVTVTGTPKFAFRLGAATRQAAYASGSGSAALVFARTVQAGEVDRNGISWNSLALALDGGTITQTGATTAARLTHAAQASLEGHRVDAAPPMQVSASVQGMSLVLVYDEPLDPASMPATGAYTVTATVGATTTNLEVSEVSIYGIWVTLALDAAPAAGATVTLAYAPPASNPVQDEAGNDAPAFSGQKVNGAAGNTAATGAPTITGTAQVGQTLTAGTTAIMDADGLTSVSYTYQWIRVATDNTETNISSATASTYTLVAADQGTTVKVTVSFTDDANNPETRTSAATATVSAAANTPATGAPTITGTAQVGQTLTAGTTAIMDADGLTSVSYTYQWIRVATDNTETNISSATASTYTLVAADQGTTVKVTVSFTDDANNPETRTSAATAAVSAAPNTPATGAPTITGTAQVGQTLTAGTTAIMDADGLTSVSYTYQWIRVATDNTETNISSAAASTYMLVAADQGTTVKVTVSFTDDANNPETRTSAATATVSAAANTPATGAPTITGTAQVGQTLTAGTTAIMDADGLTSVSYTYQWIGVATDNTETNISSATASTYTLVAADQGTTVKVTVSFTDDANNPETLTSAATAAVSAAPNTPATGAPTITGTAQVGQTLTASTTGIADANGLTTPNYTYQWIRVDGTEADIAGENSSTYTLGDADLGKTLKVRVTFADDLGHTETLTSAATATVGAGAVATAPTVNDVAVTSTPASGTTYYLAGEVIEFTVTFSAPVTVTGTPKFAFRLGAATRQAAYASGSGSAALVFARTVQAGEVDRNGISWNALALALDGGTITQTGATTAARLTHAEQASLEGHRVDAAPPMQVSASVQGLALVLVYDEPLDPASMPATGAYTVTATVGATTTNSAVSEVSIYGIWVTLTLDAAPAAGATVTLAYAPPASNPVQDEAGNDAPAFSGQSVRLGPPPPPPVTDLAQVLGVGVAPGNAQLVVTWTAVSTATGYTVQWISGGQGYNTGDRQATVTTGSTTRYTIPSLTNGTEYTVRVIATRTGATDGLPSDEMTGTPRVPPPPPPPPVTDLEQVLGVGVAPGNAQLVVTWTAVSTATGYTVQWTSGGQGYNIGDRQATVTSGSTTRYTIPSLTNGTEYTVRVIATRTGATDGPPSAEVTGTPFTTPGAPQHLSGVPGDEQVMLTWDAPSSDGGSAILRYEYAIDDSGTWIDAGLDLEETVPGLTNGREYAFEVRALNSAGPGAPARTAATPLGMPSVPESLTATGGDGEVVLEWTEPADDGGSPVTGYEYRYAAGQAVPEDVTWRDAGTELTATVSGLENETRYTFEVRARNRVGPGETSGTTALPLRLRAELFSTAVLATEGEALVVGVRRSGRLAFPAHAYIGVTDSALPGVTATEEGRDDGLGRHRLEFAAGAAEATVTVTVAFDGERRQDRVLSATLDSAELEVDGVRRPYELVTPTLVVPVTEGDAGLSVADARVQGKSSVLAFTVSLDRTRDVAVRVDYATEDGAARAGEDYTPVSGTLTIEAGGRERTVEVPVLPALHVTGERTLTLRLSNAVSAVIDDGVATGVIVRESELPKAWLARFGRTASDHAAQAIARRLEAGQRETQVTVAGRRVDGLSVDGLLSGVLPSGGWRPASAVEDMATRLAAPALAASGAPFGGVDADPGTPGLRAGTWGGAPGALDREPFADAGQTLRRAVLPDFGYRLPGAEEALMGTSFYVERGAQQDVGGGTWAAWGDVAATRFEGDAGGLALNGDVVTGTAGLDRQWRAVLVGLALSRSSGEGGYGTGAGTIASTLTSVHPYVQVRFGERAQVWGAAGWGRGGLEITPESGAALEADLRNSMAAAGARAVLMGAGGLEIALRSDFLWTETSSDGTAALAEAVGTASRGRLMLEGAGQIQGLGGVVRPKVEGGVRYDGGDAETGQGFEVGGGLDWARGSLTLQVNGRMLVAHADESYEEWGYSGSLVYEPGADGLGLQMRVGSSAGAAASGIRNLWALENASGLVRGGAVPFAQRFAAEVGYGIGRGTLWYPYFVADDSGQTRYGLKLSSGRTIGVGLEFGLRKSVDLGPEDAMLLRGELRF